MTIPVELFIWLAGGNLFVLSMVVHLQIRMYTKMARQDRRWLILAMSLRRNGIQVPKVAETDSADEEIFA